MFRSLKLEIKIKYNKDIFQGYNAPPPSPLLPIQIYEED